MTFSQKYPTLSAFKTSIYDKLYGKNNDTSIEYCEDILSNEQTRVQQSVDKTDTECMESLLSSPNRQMCSAGSFSSHQIAWDAIRETLTCDSDEIYEWLKDMPQEGCTTSKSVAAPVGTEYGQNKSLGSGFVKTMDGKICSYTTNTATVVITPDPSKPLGFAVKTAYPGNNDKDNPYNGMTLSTDKVAETIHQTNRYEQTGRNERAYLDYVSHPEKHTYGASYTAGARGDRRGYTSILVPSKPDGKRAPTMDHYKLFTDFVEISRTTIPTSYIDEYNGEIRLGDCTPVVHTLARALPELATNPPLSVRMSYDQLKTELGNMPMYRDAVNDVMYMRVLIQHQDPTPFERRKTNDRLSQINAPSSNLYALNQKDTPNGFGK